VIPALRPLVVLFALGWLWPAELAPQAPAPVGMVSAAHPLAARAGQEILDAGGSAADAGIAVQLVLGLVEPQSSGLGGGLFALYWDAERQRLSSLDGRETTPAAFPRGGLVRDETRPLEEFFRQLASGKSVGTPGAVAALVRLHEDAGRLAWSDLFQPAIRLAEEGFALSPRLHAMLLREPILPQRAGARALYYQRNAEGQWVPKPTGTLIQNPAYAASLRRIAAEGRAGFYAGALAQSLSARAQAADGWLSAEDLRAYRAKWRPPLCGRYRGYLVCSMGPPSSGGIALLQILGMVEHFAMRDHAPNSADALHILAEATKLAFADRARYVGDQDFVAVPVTGLLQPDYLRQRAALIDMARAKPASAGAPWGAPPGYGEGEEAPRPSTTHLSVVDGDGNALSLTSSIESAFGARLMAEGFLLNNQLTDFTLPRTAEDAAPNQVANAPAPGKRPRSSMTPTIIFAPDGQLFAVLGSPGGPRIISYVARSVVALIDWELTPQAAFDLPHAHAGSGALELERERSPATLPAELKARGHEVVLRTLNSGLHGLRWRADGVQDGGADKRREGVVLRASGQRAQ